MSFRVGDIVGRTSYGSDIHFRIISIDKKTNVADLKGLDMRLWADAPVEDLIMIHDDSRDKLKEKNEEKASSSVQEIKQEREQGDTSFKLPGRVLHMDGDPNYLKKCLELYKQLDIPVYGIHVPESEMPKRVFSLLKQIQPDILVVTGHDAFIRSKGSKHDMKAYRHSASFKDTIKKAREYERDRDSLIIFAGACQSYFEALIQAGANYASAPNRVNIHALDPVYIVEKACYTAINKLVNVTDIIRHSISGSAGLGGIDTRGTFRAGKPGMEAYLGEESK